MTINIVVYSDYNYMLVLIYVVSFDDDSTSNPPSSNNVRLPAAAALLRRLSERHWEGGGCLPRVLVVVKHRFGGGSSGRFGGFEVGTGGWLLALHPWSWWWPEKIKIAMSDSSRLKLTIWCRHQIQQRFFFPVFPLSFLYFKNMKFQSDSWVPKCGLKGCSSSWVLNWLVVSNIFYVHHYLGRWSNLTNSNESHQLGKQSTKLAGVPHISRPKPCWFWQLVLDLARRAVSDGTH